jgi:hypothetical protein
MRVERFIISMGVVPAKAGIHNPQIIVIPKFSRLPFDLFSKSNDREYGSRLSPGRYIERSR